MNRKGLFGGALFAAGIVSGASAQDMTLSYSVVNTGALDYNLPMVMFDDFAGPGTFGPLMATVGPTASAYAVGTGTLLYAQSESDANPATVALAAMICYFTVPADGTAELAWDWTGAQALGQQNYLLLEDLTAGTTVASVDFNAGGAQTGSMSVPLDDAVDYRWTAFAYATHDVSGSSYVSFEYSGCPCDLDGNETLNVDDIDAFVTAFTSGDLAADFDGNGSLNVDDIDAFVNCFTAGCP